MSEEENEIIMKLELAIALNKDLKLTPERIKIIVNIIENQQKEIEREKQYTDFYKDLYSDEKIRNTIIKRYRKVIEKDYISKDKIREMLEEYKSTGYYELERVLEELLEE